LTGAVQLRGTTSNGLLTTNTGGTQLLYNGSAVGTWVGTATSDLNMNSFSITNLTNLNGTPVALFGASAWATFSATTNVNVNGYNMNNIANLGTTNITTNNINASDRILCGDLSANNIYATNKLLTTDISANKIYASNYILCGDISANKIYASNYILCGDISANKIYAITSIISPQTANRNEVATNRIVPYWYRDTYTETFIPCSSNTFTQVLTNGQFSNFPSGIGTNYYRANINMNGDFNSSNVSLQYYYSFSNLDLNTSASGSIVNLNYPYKYVNNPRTVSVSFGYTDIFNLTGFAGCNFSIELYLKPITDDTLSNYQVSATFEPVFSL
jgi:hypothetical protein